MILFTIGLLIRYVIANRKFNRRGLGGLQHFRNYFTGIITILLEWLLYWLANALSILAFLLFIK